MPSLPRTVESVFIPSKMVAHYFSGIIAVQFFFFKFKAIKNAKVTEEANFLLIGQKWEKVKKNPCGSLTVIPL